MFAAINLSNLSSMLSGLAISTLAILAGCGGGEGPEGPSPDGGLIPPVDPPDDDTQEPPDTPRNNFASCFGPAESFQLMIKGRGAYFADNEPADACGIVHVDRESICLPSTTGDSNGETLPDENGETEPCVYPQGMPPRTEERLPFIATLRWGDSAPVELYTEGPGDQGYGLMASRAQARADGSPLAELKGAALPPATSWGDIYPEFAESLGFIWSVEGELNLTNCRLDLTIRGTVRMLDGYGESLDQVVLPLVTPREDGLSCVAEKDYGNEVIVIHEGSIQVSLTEADTPVTVCDPGLPCEDVHGEANPESLTVTLIHEELAPADSVQPGEESDGGDDDSAGGDGADGGIPPLDPPDGG